MKKIEAIIRPEKLEAVVSALESFGHIGLNIQDVKGHGRQKGMKELFRGQEYEIRFVPKVKLEIVIGDDKADKAVELILKTAQTGQIGDGKVFISDVLDAVRVRTAERGDGVL
jgi:nitrogen regulatory protein P-II 1